VTPVPVSGCPGWHCFDPTGRDAPLIAAIAPGAPSAAPGSPRAKGNCRRRSRKRCSTRHQNAACRFANQTGAFLETKNWGGVLGSLPNVGDVLTIDGVFPSNRQSQTPTGDLQQFAIGRAREYGQRRADDAPDIPAIVVGGPNAHLSRRRLRRTRSSIAAHPLTRRLIGRRRRCSRLGQSAPALKVIPARN